ncbi:predicted protein [Arabidopsis lyrata subsp. lyrata]|uniref:Predicted protein n=1 Tax=Arabidopsis lyrata subsp. lyrata TaxID=81972 RepID=D7KZ63_ARALL|nr:predicted protein [Arabidopsis lyrata subsp. lyrata]
MFQPRSPCSTARQRPPEPPSTSPVNLRFRFSQKRTPAKAFSLLDEANHVSTARHCSTVVPEMPPSVPPVTSHLNKLSETSESSTTAGKHYIISPIDVPSAVMPTTIVDRVVPVLPSPSPLPTSRPQPRRSKRLHSSAAPQVSTPAPAPKLRLRDTSEDVKLKTSSSPVISTLAKPSPTKVTALMSQLRRYTKSEYSIYESVFPATLFFDILKPQKWVSSMTSLANLTTAQIDNVRLRYALDIYETYVKKL